MVLARARRKISVIRTGFILLARIYRRDRNLARLMGGVWFAGTRHGLIGLRQWIINAVPTDHQNPEPLPISSPPSPPVGAAKLYHAWLERYDVIRLDARGAARCHMNTLDLPELLILAVITRDDLPSITRIIESWRTSMHTGWRAAIVVRPDWNAPEQSLVRAAANKDERIHLVTSAEEVDGLRNRYKFLLLTFGASLLHSLSTYMFLEAAIRTNAAVVYSDHDFVTADGARVDPTFKPQFSPEYLSRFNYVGDCLLIAHKSVWTASDSVELFHITPAGFDDLVGRILLLTSAQKQPIEHLPFLLFHALKKHPRIRHRSAELAVAAPLISIVIPSGDALDHLKLCIESILEVTYYDLDRIELVVVETHSASMETLDYLANLATQKKAVFVREARFLNHGEINNIGADAAQGDILVFLSNCAAIYDKDWLSKLAGFAMQPDVGVVGCKTLTSDMTVQRGGGVVGGNRGDGRYFLRPVEAGAAADPSREISLLAGVCLAVRKNVFNALGGFEPILHTAWYEVGFCLSALSMGFRNIAVEDALVIDHSSKKMHAERSRDAVLRELSEADYTRRKYRAYFYDDPFYNPNLSLEREGELAEPPRVRLPWYRKADRAPRILLLSLVYKLGYGVPVVMQQHARKLLERGYEVFIGGPAANNELSFHGCQRVFLASAQEAAAYAFINEIALVVIHTPPFFEVPFFLGGHIPTLAHDHGEPPAHFFQGPTHDYLIRVGDEKRRAAALTTAINVISQSVKEETLYKDARVVGNANSHLPAWSEALRPARDRFREERGWKDKFVVLTVCRFHEGERVYKGLDKIAEIIREFPFLYPVQSRQLQWVLAGAGTEEDVRQAVGLGFLVYPNVSDAALADLYKAADAYMSFSRWEGYNLGIGQALAMGLPVLASDIAVHREFGIKTTNSVLVACEWLAEEAERRRASSPEQRIAKVYDWDISAGAFVDVVDEMLRVQTVQKPRFGASGTHWQARTRSVSGISK